MTQIIQRLSEEVICRIAAGEVVESPASLLKELIENSLDAKALNITIWIEEGGQERICVEDDGCGMGKEDALLCLERHATSKIFDDQDLYRLHTMGFRGEALAAIGAVSELEIKTSLGREGHLVKMSGGKIVEIGSCVRNRGTTVDVRSLFFNVPARKKFLKKRGHSAMVRVVEAIAMSHPEVSFSLFVDRKKVFDLMATSWKKRIEKLLGPFLYTIEEEVVQGVFSACSEASSSRKEQYLFINRRLIFSPLVSKAVETAYGTRISEGYHPPFVLFLTLSPEEIDVNVHPQKKEVRFADEAKVFRIVEKAVSKLFVETPSFQTPLHFEMPKFFLEKSFDFSREEEATFRPQELSLAFIEKPIAFIEGILFLQKASFLAIDIRLAHARVLYEMMQKKEDKWGIQKLIFPVELDVADEEVVEHLMKLGLECRWMGRKRCAVDAMPAFLDQEELQAFVDLWQQNGKKLDLSCSFYANKRKKEYTFSEALEIWKYLLQCQDQTYDPMGRKIVVSLDYKRLKKCWED